MLITAFVSAHNLSLSEKKLSQNQTSDQTSQANLQATFQYSFPNDICTQADVDLYCFTIWLKYNAF